MDHGFTMNVVLVETRCLASLPTYQDFYHGGVPTLARNPDTRHLSVLRIAQESGFNSKATFYTAFKKKTALTPSEFLAKQA